MISELIGLESSDYEKFNMLFNAVVKKIEKKACSVFFRKQIAVILADQTTCFARPVYFYQTSSDISAPIEVSFIVLSPRIINDAKEIATYTIAHELAHAYLGHGLHFADLCKAKQNELDADQQVIDWGFKKELLATPHNYLYGNGINNVFGSASEGR